MAANIATLNLSIVANTANLAAGLGRATASVKKFSAGIGASGRMLQSLGTQYVMRAVDSLVSMVREQMNVIDASSKMAATLGIGLGALQGMEHAANLSGVSTEQLGTSMVKLQRAAVEAANGSTTFADAFDRLGIDAKSFANLAADEQMRVLAGAMEGVGSASERNALLIDLFGRSGAALAPMFAGGAAGLSTAQEEASKLGISLTDIDGIKIEMANDAMTRLGQIFIGIARLIAVELAPLIVGLANYLTEVGTTGEGMGGIVSMALQGIGAGLVWVINIVDQVRRAFMQLQTWVMQSLTGIFIAFEKVAMFIDARLPESLRGAGEEAQRLADSMRDSSEEAQRWLDATNAQPLWGDALQTAVRDAQKQVDIEAQATLDTRINTPTFEGIGTKAKDLSPAALLAGTAAAFSQANKNRAAAADPMLKAQQDMVARQDRGNGLLARIERKIGMGSGLAEAVV